MAKRTIKNAEIMKIAKQYAKEVRENYNTETIILFGSYAKGTEEEDSDIDIAVVIDDLKKDLIDEELNLMKLRRKIDIRIEPHIIRLEDYKKISNPFIKEIIDTGIKVA